MDTMNFTRIIIFLAGTSLIPTSCILITDYRVLNHRLPYDYLNYSV
jgi:hypothetical protein